MDTPNAHDARELLDRAESTSRQAAGFALAWLCYLALCAGGAITAVGLAYANVTSTPTLPAWLAGGLWILVGVVFTAGATATSPPTRRGFGSRWFIMMVVWVILWAATTILNSHFTLGHGTAVAAAFLAAAVIGLVWEVTALKKGVK
ncbi:MAG: hypothetical protein Q4G50_03410 [Corynebacterium sp.]|uniref:hypothetical protein n=1 Tax=Corynebacterium sp. TaxID=1720 RepID=UPI0026DF0053|nr:hypothetical protein [Corynebacterium sp.]MDO5669031.1 hypothetical protein [Corynebacterium sp.]